MIVGNPSSLRVQLFAEALARNGCQRPHVWSYVDVLGGRLDLGAVPPRAIVRIESPGKDFAIEQRLLALGASDAAAEGSPWLAADALCQHAHEPGRILFPRQWYLGFCRALRAFQTALQDRGDVLLSAWPADIEILFDKPRCHARCRAADIPVPDALPPIGSYDELVAEMDARRWNRAFAKLAHGSSASGAVALFRHRGRVEAATTVELVRTHGDIRLYNARPVRHTRDADEIRLIVDTLAPHGIHVERWLPKASLGRGGFDLRLVVIAGTPRHTVVREGRSPITNLQLGNRRRAIDELLRRMPDQRWLDVLATCTRVGQLFGRCLQLGIDVLLTPGYRQHAVLEVNAFGDLLPRLLHEGATTYDAQISALRAS